MVNEMNYVSLSGIITEIKPIIKKNRESSLVMTANLEVYTVLKDNRFKISTILCFGKGKVARLLNSWKSDLPKYVIINGRLGTYIEKGYIAKLGVVIDEIIELDKLLVDIKKRGLEAVSIALNDNLVSIDDLGEVFK